MNLKDLQIKVKAAKELAVAQAVELTAEAENIEYLGEMEDNKESYNQAIGRAAAYSHILSDIDEMIDELENNLLNTAKKANLMCLIDPSKADELEGQIKFMGWFLGITDINGNMLEGVE